MDVDYTNLGAETSAVENAEQIEPDPSAPIVNVDANFLIPASDRHREMAFPRLHQIEEHLRVALAAGSLVPVSEIPQDKIDERPYRRPDFAAEWQNLKKAWSLAHRGKEKLADRLIKDASETYYRSDPLSGLPDWLWRFGLYVTQPGYELLFRMAFGQIRALIEKNALVDFGPVYERDLVAERRQKYLDVIRDYFSAFAEFSQVHFRVVRGLPIGDDAMVSTGFEATRMFYGNAFEAFASLVDLLAYLNNLQAGRSFDVFEQLTRKQYLELDKSGKFGPFSKNGPFISICEERDNQLRNASHHGQLIFDRDTQIITYRAGKGGTGVPKTITYAEYLARCSKIFFQTMTLFRMEVLMCQVAGFKYPI